MAKCDETHWVQFATSLPQTLVTQTPSTVLGTFSPKGASVCTLGGCNLLPPSLPPSSTAWQVRPIRRPVPLSKARADEHFSGSFLHASNRRHAPRTGAVFSVRRGTGPSRGLSSMTIVGGLMGYSQDAGGPASEFYMPCGDQPFSIVGSMTRVRDRTIGEGREVTPHR